MVRKYSKLALSIALALVLTSASIALSKPNNSEVYVKNAISQYNKSLRHENKGVVGSSIYNLMRVKALYPSAGFSKTLNELDRLVEKGTSVEIRYKAFIALTYFNTNKWDHLIESRDSSERNNAFSEISKELESTFFEVSKN